MGWGWENSVEIKLDLYSPVLPLRAIRVGTKGKLRREIVSRFECLMGAALHWAARSMTMLGPLFERRLMMVATMFQQRAYPFVMECGVGAEWGVGLGMCMCCDVLCIFYCNVNWYNMLLLTECRFESICPIDVSDDMRGGLV